MDIKYRKPTMDDAEAVLMWRNNPKVYKYFKEPKEIKLSSHIKWFERAIENPNIYFCMAEINGDPAGVLRLDLEEKGRIAKVSIQIDPKFHGKGLASKLLLFAESELKEIKTFEAEVHKENPASLRLFLKNGYAEHHQDGDFVVFKKEI